MGALDDALRMRRCATGGNPLEMPGTLRLARAANLLNRSNAAIVLCDSEYLLTTSSIWKLNVRE